MVAPNIEIDQFGKRQRCGRVVQDSGQKVYHKEKQIWFCIVMEKLGNSLQSFIK